MSIGSAQRVLEPQVQAQAQSIEPEEPVAKFHLNTVIQYLLLFQLKIPFGHFEGT